MGTLLKYLFYIFVIAAVYFVGVGFYQGRLNKDSTIGEMANHVTTNTKEAIESGYNATKDAVQGGIEQMKDEGENAVQNGENEVEMQIDETIDEIKK